MEGVSKGQQRVLGIVGAVIGLLAAYFVWDAVIGDRMIEAPRFVLAVLTGGGVGMILYTLIKDGGTLLLKRQQAGKAGAPASAAPPAPPAAPPPAPRAEAPRSRPVRAERPIRRAPAAERAPEPEPDPDTAPQRPLRAQRPLRPRD